MGAVNTAGSATEPELSPLADQTVTEGRAAIFICWFKVEDLRDGEERAVGGW